MKKYFLSIFAISALFTSCASEDHIYNDDSAKAYEASGEFFFANAQKELVDQLTTPSVNLNVFRYFSQYWAATLYRAESRYDLTTRDIPDNHWNNLYTQVLANLKKAKQDIMLESKPASMSQANWDKTQKNRLAIIEILNVYTFQILVDSFGDVPYSQSLDVENMPLPKYDNDTDIYSNLLTRLNTAIGQLDTGYGSITATQDGVYGGNVSKWLLFANSLKAKLAINLADVNPTVAKQNLEQAFAAGLIETNTNNAVLTYNSFSPNYNPIYEELVASDRNDFVPATVFVNRLNTLNDPRRPIYFTPLEGTSNTYVGGTYGSTNTQPYQDSYSHIGNKIKQANSPGVLIDAAEINFILAEAAERGYSVTGTAASYYEKAIKASMSYWGVSDVDANAYYNQTNVNYLTATGAWKEKIGNQAWIAMYNRGFESWTFFRRLDFPSIVAPASAYPVAEGKIPVRLTYPSTEPNVNGTNYQTAVSAIGGDKLTTKVFWDLN
ncbi:hypothetical protein CHRY9390_02069 [Chryseobacterium aquaeductus]|uniref:SusD-like starch-binding protein associating with outer membrane n=1 Tax=Chryseobacterium aquaeductus TaxID=2675056 RepID=A0A9N8MH06_9FLAO|nr:SusD/RagB family nutrient-binding outer membrane lipoprotein [Chryseobacterium aquaeductus]CAA7331370.1 hypothetical protein CHRY9390_02069 [Chryseobacterium potabilaquae]CAD7809797.1 hypothetical protein CHRY9390_02069 [Chryseobacterium aquaeductus]